MNRYLLLILLLFVSNFSQAAEPEVLASFFGHSGIRDKSSVYHGEMLENFTDKPTLGEGMPNNVQYTVRKLDESQNKAVYAVLLSDGQHSQDWYAFLVKESDIWKLSAVRCLALPGVFYMALQELEKKSPRTEKEEWQYQNMLLTIKSDSDLKQYLRSHFFEFKTVAKLYSEGNKEQAKIAAKALLTSFIESDDGTIKLNIGGILDNSVGFLYVPPGAHPPKMSADEIIYVEEIDDGWFIYKTT